MIFLLAAQNRGSISNFFKELLFAKHIYIDYTEVHCTERFPTAASAALIDPHFPTNDLTPDLVLFPGELQCMGFQKYSLKGQSSQIWLRSPQILFSMSWILCLTTSPGL